MMASIIVLVGLGATYAYFMANVGGNGSQEVGLTAGTMTLELNDLEGADKLSGEKLMFNGNGLTTRFKITNTGSLTTYAKLLWNNLTNTYNAGSLEYTKLPMAMYQHHSSVQQITSSLMEF